MDVSKGLAAVVGIIIGSLDLSLAAVLKFCYDFTGWEVGHDRHPVSHILCYALEMGECYPTRLSYGSCPLYLYISKNL